ncbi:peritrophin-44 isoform X2 [Drosophila kikkawai]|uniref:Peritrophin-44 isoform X2 n=1 Tax=Drosophila kikkawai TaxID=30033 RepID=A0A6P4IJ24_DROKI|nr:peritrophin-44 isoform X2 [Drosophila kikkawai]
MKGFDTRICALVACLLLASQASGYTMEQMCAQWSGTGYVGNPTNCRAWGYCQGQKLVGWGTCPDDYIFNSQKGICDYPYRTVCATSAVQTCTAATSPMYVADPSNCTQYGYCDGKGSISYGDCGVGGVYSASSRSCVWGPACPQSTICQFMLSDIYVGDPDNCGSWLSCNNGYGTPGTCGSGLTYNLVTGNCQKTNTCNGNTDSGSSNGQFTVGDTSSTICKDKTNGYEAAPALTGKSYRFVSDLTTCYGFYYCESATAVGVWNQCPTGTHFDPTIGKCVSPAAYACPYNRCGNVNSVFMTRLGTSCEGYTVCASGGIGSCPTKNPYYDEVYDICTATAPGFAICS